MASAWGSWVHTDDWRCGVSAWVVSETETTATVRVQNIFENSYLVSSSSGNSVRCACNGTTRSADMALGTRYGHTGQKVVKTEDFTVNKSYTSKSVTCSATIVVGNGSTGTSSASTSVGIPARRYSKPNPPTGLTAARVSDAQIDLSWKNGEVTSDKPIDEVAIYRFTAFDGEYIEIASVKYPGANYTDRAVAPNRMYSYFAVSSNRDENSATDAEHTEYADVYTTPAAPLSVQLSKATGTAVRVAADVSNVESASEYEVEVSANGGEWTHVATVDYFPVTADVSGRARFRVRSVRGELKSAWTESAEITTITPPLAPRLTGLPGVAPTGSTQVVSWVPNHPDGTEQTAAQVELTVNGAASTADLAGERSYTIPSGAMASAGSVSVRVRTKGLDPSWGAWSATLSMGVAVPPSAVLTNPPSNASVVEVLPLAVSWDASDATGISEQTLRLLDASGRELWRQSVATDARSLQLPYRLSNKSAYSLSLAVRGGSTLSVTATRSFTTDYIEPAAPLADVELDGESLSVAVTVHEGTEDGAPPTASFDVVRVSPDGSRWTVASGLTDSQQAIDPLPPLNVDFTYDVVANSEMDTQSVLSVPFHIRTGAVAFNFGASANICETFAYDHDWSHSVARSTALYDFADGGEAGGLPVAYTSTTVSSTRGHGMTCVDVGQLRRMQALAAGNGVCWYRDLYGGRARCAASFDFSAGVPYDLIKVSASMTEVRFREAW